MDFDELVRLATGHGVYDYQRKVALCGLPELLRVPTGAGKTLAVILGWLYRRRTWPDATPRRLVYVLPMRALVEQVSEVAMQWMAEVAPEVVVNVLMGGEGVHDYDSRWVLRPEQDAVVVGTLDMILSRALNRGYGESRFIWPVAFGLLNSGSAWVFDEVQLMGPALGTSRQLEAFRRSLGTASPCSSTWMSATVDQSCLSTVDLDAVSTIIGLSEADRTGPLRTRLEARKAVHHLDLDPDPRRRARSLASQLAAAHLAGTRTIAVMNTVAAAVDLWRELDRLELGAEVVLLHSRFRPGERSIHYQRAVAAVDRDGPGRIVVATQVLEAGVDISSATLFTEAAPWPSVVQRAGRCNREGEIDGAQLLWAEPAKPAPYEASDVSAAGSALRGLEGIDVTPEDLAGQEVDLARVSHPVLRRRDLVELFDTSPDLSGNDLDIGRLLRDGEDLDVAVAWWEVSDAAPDKSNGMPARDERCPVPIGQLRELWGPRGRDVTVWRFDHLDQGWVRCRRADDIRPGAVLVMRAGDGCYDPQVGWDPASRAPVPGASRHLALAEDPARGDTATDSDPATFGKEWVELLRHLEEVAAYVGRLVGELRPEGLGPDLLEAAVMAGRLHDVGKAHDAFQAMLVSGLDHEASVARPAGGPWAKSDHGGGSYAKDRRHFRHELVSALALLGQGRPLLEGLAEPELVIYLVAAHHGRVRVGIRSLPGDGRPLEEPDRLAALGVWDHDGLGEVTVPGGVIPAQELDLTVMELGTGEGGRSSWGELALCLRDRADVGPFRLGFLEALVRVADWQVSSGKGMPDA